MPPRRTPLPGMNEAVLGRGAMRYPDLSLCYERYLYKTGPTLPQLDDVSEVASPQKLEEMKRIADLASKANHPSVDKSKFFRMQRVNKRLQGKVVYSSFSSLDDSVFAKPGSAEGTVGKASKTLNYTAVPAKAPIPVKNGNIHMSYKPVYKPMLQQVFGAQNKKVISDVRKGTCPRATLAETKPCSESAPWTPSPITTKAPSPRSIRSAAAH